MFNQDLHQTARELACARACAHYLLVVCNSLYAPYYYSSFIWIPCSDITQNYGHKMNFIGFMLYQHLPVSEELFN